MRIDLLPRLACLAITASLTWVLSPLSAYGQSPTSTATPDPKLGLTSIRSHGWAEDGSLVLGVKITGGKAGTQLGRVKGSGSRESLDLFTMASSTLTDVYSDKKLSALGNLPTKPFFGAMTAITRLDAGDSVVFGVAFPRPPEPPKDKDGNPMPFKLKLLVPDMVPLEFNLPYAKPTAQTKAP